MLAYFHIKYNARLAIIVPVTVKQQASSLDNLGRCANWRLLFYIQAAASLANDLLLAHPPIDFSGSIGLSLEIKLESIPAVIASFSREQLTKTVSSLNDHPLVLSLPNRSSNLCVSAYN